MGLTLYRHKKQWQDRQATDVATRWKKMGQWAGRGSGTLDSIRANSGALQSHAGTAGEL